MAIDPAATSARPAVMTIHLLLSSITAPDSPAARAKGTVSPSDMPITMSRTASEAVKCFSTWGVFGMRGASCGTRAGGHPYLILMDKPPAPPGGGQSAPAPYGGQGCGELPAVP